MQRREDTRAAVLRPEEATQQQPCCSEKMRVVLDDERHGSRVDRAQSADQTEYARGGTTMEEVGGGVPICVAMTNRR